MNEQHQNELLKAVAEADLEKTKHFIEYGMTEPGVFDAHHRSLLHSAVESLNPELVSYLIDYVGLSPLEGDCDGITPYDIAVQIGDERLISVFKERTNIAPEEIIHNPVRSGFFPDPSIIRVDEDYYMVNSSFVFFPCIPISHSKDLVNWEIVGYAIDNPDYIDMSGFDPGRGFWAPDISYSNGKYYIAATLRENDSHTPVRHQMIVSSDKPEGPYSKPIFIEEDGIDPSLFHDDDGRHYMLLNRGVRILELNDDCSEVITPARLLYYGWNKHATEGPHLIKKDGYYYLFMAEGGTGDGHMISCARSKTLDGPFVPAPNNPLLTTTDSGAYLQRTGHGKPFLAHNGKWYIVFLCSRKCGTDYSLLGRETALSEMTWENGWPVINNGQGAPAVIKSPFGASKMTDRIPESKAFFEYNDMRLTRQTEIKFTLAEHFVLTDDDSAYPRGVVFYYDDYSYCTFAVVKIRGHLELQICEAAPKPTLGWRKFVDDQIGQTIDLYVHTDKLDKKFAFGFDGERPKTVAIIRDMTYLTDEGVSTGKRFTGPLYGTF